MEILNFKITTKKESETEKNQTTLNTNQNVKLILKISGLNVPIPGMFWKLGLGTPRYQDIV